MQLRVRALESILTEKGYVEPAALDAIVEAYETKVGPHRGAQVVARAWVDPQFKDALVKDATAAIAALGMFERVSEHIVAVANTPHLHNIVVCTLCSCYPWDMLGLPPVWYKSAPYRSRAVSDPRGILREFGVAPGSRSGSGIRPRRPASSCCRCGRRAPRVGTKTSLRRSSPATA